MNKPNKLLLAGLGAAAFAGMALSPQPSSAQAPGEQQQIAQLIAEIAQQQTQIVANQKLIDEKVATIAEHLRLAKIFVSRSGGTGAPK